MDEKAFHLLKSEQQRQRDGIDLIPSENYVSEGVLRALGSEFTNKYAEGYPGQRYYGGQEYTDRIEQLAIDRAKVIFGADHANVQPHSGAPANIATYFAWLEPGDTVLGMDLSHGGHLTHGHPVTYMARLYNFVRYGMKSTDTGEIDYDHVRRLAKKHKPKILLAGFSSYPRELDWSAFADIAAEVDAVAMADVAHIAGLIAGGVSANPLDAGFHVMTTTTHKTLRGPRGGIILSKGTVGNPLKKPEKNIENLPTLIDRQVFPGLQGGPHMNTIMAKAVALHEAQQPAFKTYAKAVVANAQALAADLMDRGVKLITNGTDNHLLLIDVQSSFGIDGKEAEERLEAVGLTVNKNAIPDDENPPFRPSGIRLGTPGITTRGATRKHMQQLGEWVTTVLTTSDHTSQERVKKEVQALAHELPIPTRSA